MKKNSRRSFLKKSTLAGLSVGLSKSVFAIKKNLKMDNLVVGHGNFKYVIDKKISSSLPNSKTDLKSEMAPSRSFSNSL